VKESDARAKLAEPERPRKRSEFLRPTQIPIHT
jgi:hypothetical protein